MNKNKNYALSANIDEKMNNIVLKIKENISKGKYEIKDWDAFVETAILIFDKMIQKNITPFVFESFIESCTITKVFSNDFDA